MKDDYKNEPDNSIYHFTNLKIGLEFILLKKSLRLNPIIDTNDPRENKSFSFSAANGKFTKEKVIEEHLEWNDKISKILRKNSKVICFSEDYNIKDEWFDGYNLPRMWAQYGDNHKGVCFELDKGIFKKENSSIIFDKYFKRVKYVPKFNLLTVDYDSIRQIGIENYTVNFRNANIDYIFFTKFIDWEAEREVRLLHFGDDNINEFVTIENSLKRIILGVDFPMVYLPAVIKLANKITIEQIYFENGQFKSWAFRDEYLKQVLSL